MEARGLRNAVVGLVSILVISATIVFAWIYWSNPAVFHYDNLGYVQLLRTACSSQREEQLEGVYRAITQRRDSGKMSDEEWSEINDIIEIARGGKWIEADRQAYRLEQGQLSRRRR